MIDSLLILESNLRSKPKGYDHTLSLSLTEAESYSEDYVTPGEVEKIDNEIFDQLTDYLQKKVSLEGYSYRGVHLFWCFKKKLLNLMSFTEARYAVFQRAIKRLDPSVIWLEDQPEELSAPFLKSILEMSPWQGASRIRLVEAFARCPVRGTLAAGKQPFVRGYWPERCRWGNVGKSEVVIYSDLKKSMSVMRTLRPTRTVLYSDVKSPRLFFRSLKDQYSLYQSAYGETERPAYEEKAKRYLDQLRMENPFLDFRFSELKWGDTLWRASLALFRKELPKLLYHLDQIHGFFQKTPFLKSALLDEDIAPAKNAFCQIAREYGVSTYVACHGALGKKSSYLPLTADRMFVWGNAQKRKLIRWGCGEEKIIVSGCGRFASFGQKEPQKTRIEIAKRIGLDPAKPIVLVGFMTSAGHRRRLFETHRRRMMLEILGLARDHQAVQFIIKVKNRLDTNGKFCDEWIQANGLEKRVVTIQEIDALTLAIASDLVIIHGTTLGIEAFAMKKPVISYYDRVCRMFEEYREHGAFFVANDDQELRKVFTELIERKAIFQPDAFREARFQCLNEGERLPEEIIASCLQSCERGRLGSKENAERVLIEQ